MNWKKTAVLKEERGKTVALKEERKKIAALKEKRKQITNMALYFLSYLSLAFCNKVVLLLIACVHPSLDGTESLLAGKCIFCQSAKATNESYLRFLEKSILQQKLSSQNNNLKFVFGQFASLG